ncbi:MAG TPA: radical SAM protein [bacterium]|nr:radical SAM protein [bacterium]
MANVLFIQNNYFNWLGPMWISAVLKRHGHQARLVTVFSEAQVRRAVRRIKPDLVGMHTLTGAHRFSLRAAAAAKEALPGVKVILGGPHATFFPEIVKDPAVDFVCRGEGEYAVLDLCNRLDAGGPVDDIANIWAKIDGRIAENDVRPLLEDLDSLPFPDRELYWEGQPRPLRTAYFMAGRGCPHRCAMCFNEKNMGLYRGKGSYVRMRSAENVIAEIEEVRGRYGNTTLYFEDDTFTVKRDWSRAFLDQYRSQVGLPFFMQTRADKLDAETASQLRRAGCYLAGFSVESGSERVRNGILRKNISTASIIQAAELLHGAGIPFHATNILGIPGETVEEGLMTVNLNIKIKTDNPWFSVFQPYPSTSIEEAVKREWGLDNLNPDMMSDNYHSWSIFNHDPQVRQLANLHKFAYWTVKHPGLLPLVKRLIKLPPNPAFILVHRMAHMFVYAHGHRLSAWKGFSDGMKMSFSTPFFQMIQKLQGR